jgi:hypothetical protein
MVGLMPPAFCLDARNPSLVLFEQFRDQYFATANLAFLVGSAVSKRLSRSS